MTAKKIYVALFCNYLCKINMRFIYLNEIVTWT